MKDNLNLFDLVFVVDSTGSMGTFIAAARKLMIKMARTLVANADVDIKIGVVEYRDHTPQDTLLTRVYQLGTLAEAEKNLHRLSPNGGGDGPEAVYDGVVAACKEINWRDYSRRVAVLVGDAPPHGVGSPGDGFPSGCPCGQTIESTAGIAEEHGITLYALSLNSSTTQHFTKMARYTGGEGFVSGSGDAAITKIQNILTDEFSNLDLDRAVFEAWEPEVGVDNLAEKLNRKPNEIALSIGRLMSRNLFADRLSALVAG